MIFKDLSSKAINSLQVQMQMIKAYVHILSKTERNDAKLSLLTELQHNLGVDGIANVRVPLKCSNFIGVSRHELIIRS